MPAYVIAIMTVNDSSTYSKYTDRTPEIIQRYGGKFLTRGEEVTTLEGAAPEGRMVLLEFPNLQKIRQWHADPEYQDVLKYRLVSSTMHSLIAQEGGTNTANPEPKL